MSKRQDFNDTADKRHAELLASGMSIPWIEMQLHLQKLLKALSSPSHPTKLSTCSNSRRFDPGR